MSYDKINTLLKIAETVPPRFIGPEGYKALYADITATLHDIISGAIWEHYEREAVVTLADGREVVVAPDLASVHELAREIEAAIVGQYNGPKDSE